MMPPQRPRGRDGDRDTTELGYLLCPDRGLRLAIGRPVRDKGAVTGFEYSPASPAAVLGRRVYLQALSRFLADSPAANLSLTAASVGWGHLREVGGTPEDGGISVGEYLHDQPHEWVTYFAIIWEGYPRNDPTGIVRRREFAQPTKDLSVCPDLVDEGFHRTMRWEDDDYLERYWIGHDDDDHVEISESEALTFVLRMLVKFLPLVESQ